MPARPDPAHEATLFALRRRADAWKASLDVPTPDYAQNYTANLTAWAKSLPDDVRTDSWVNMVTGHGTSRDKTAYTQFEANGRLTFAQLEALYADDDLAARIVDAEVEQAYREGFEIRLVAKGKRDTKDAADPFPTGAKLPKPGQPKPKRGEFADLEDELAEECSALGVADSFEEAHSLGRLYGGSGIFVGANDGQKPDKPLDETRIKSVDFLHVLDRYSLWPNTFYSDPSHPKFGKPQTYRIFRPVSGGIAPSTIGQSTGMGDDIVHETRLIIFPGVRTTIRRRVANFSWDDSVLQRANAVLMQFGLSWAAATHLLSDAAQGVYSVKNLLDMIAGQNKDALLDRMAIVDQQRSSARMVLVDADNEKFERTATPFTGIPEMLDRVAQRLAAAVPMPLTVLMGTSPAGLNATGDSDIRQWYDRIRMKQTKQVAPRLKRLITLMLAARGKTELSVELKFKPLWQPTPKELAEERKLTAETDDTYIAAGVLLEEEVRESRFGGDGYSAETTIDADLGPDALQAIKDARTPVPPVPGQENETKPPVGKGSVTSDAPPPPADKPS